MRLAWHVAGLQPVVHPNFGSNVGRRRTIAHTVNITPHISAQCYTCAENRTFSLETCHSTSSPPSCEAMAHRVLFLPGDGVGHELLAAAKRVLQATGVCLRIETMEYGRSYERTHGETVKDPCLSVFRCECSSNFIKITTIKNCLLQAVPDLNPQLAAPLLLRCPSE